MSALSKYGKSSRICSGVMPPASISRIWLTVIRMPRIVGCPPQTSGLTVIRSSGMALLYKNALQRQSDHGRLRGRSLLRIPHQNEPLVNSKLSSKFFSGSLQSLIVRPLRSDSQGHLYSGLHQARLWWRGQCLDPYMNDRLILFPVAPDQRKILAAKGRIVIWKNHHQSVVWNLIRDLRMLNQIFVEFRVQHDIFVRHDFLIHFS